MRPVARRTLLWFALALVVALGTAGARLEGAAARRTAWLDVAVRQARATDRLPVWVYFTDKGSAADLGGQPALSPRAVTRRFRRGTISAERQFEDRPLASDYVARVGAAATRVRQTSRWLNAMSVEATPAQIDTLAALPFVARVDIVRRARRNLEPVTSLPVTGSRGSRTLDGADDAPLDYGTGLDQVQQIRVPELHARGLHGEGVVVAVFDSGFPNLAHEAFAAYDDRRRTRLRARR